MLTTGESLKAFRAQNKVTCAKLSESSGIHKSTISGIECGYLKLNDNYLVKMDVGYKALGINATPFFKQLIRDKKALGLRDYP